MADIFSDDIIEDVTPNELNLADLVGEGRKYSDPDQLAKAYANIERHARTLEAENATMRAKTDAEEARQRSQTNPDDNREQLRSDDSRGLAPKESVTPGKEDFRSQIREEVQALNEQERGQSNLNAAATKLSDILGSPAKASEAIRRRADELGVSVEWLKDSASRSPNAFYATMGIDNVGSSDRRTPAPSSDVRLDDRGATKNFAYYDKFRTEDKVAYFSAAMQREMQASAKQLGDDFYKR